MRHIKETDAKQSVCPIANVRNPEGGNFNRGGGADSYTNCLGSKCMSWVFETSQVGYCNNPMVNHAKN